MPLLPEKQEIDTCCGNSVARRQILQGLAIAGGLAAAGPALAQGGAAAMAPQPGDFLVSDLGTTPLTPNNIRLDGRPFHGWAMSPEGVVRKANYINKVQLFRYDVAELPEESPGREAEGVIALSVICTHAGCEASEWIGELTLIACPCHGSAFSPKADGAVDMGPALRKLPQLRLALADGRLVVTESWDSYVGGDEIGADDR